MSWRKIVFWIHLAIGCLAGTVILVMAVTGILLAYQRQLTSWIERDFRSTPRVLGAAPLPIEARLAKVMAQSPVPPSAITLRNDAMAPAEVSFGREHIFLVDVYSGEVLGESSPAARSFFQRIENWHRWLGASNENRAAARAITGICNLGFLFLVVSGPFLWLPRKWSWGRVKAVSLFQSGLSGRARDFNWHNVIGLWCVVPLFLVVLSGVVMSYPWANNLLYRLTGSELPVQGNGQRREPDTRRQKNSGESSLAGLNPLWIRAEQQVPAWKSVTLRLPPSGHGPLIFTIDTGNGGRPDQRSQLALQRTTAEVVRWETFSSYNAGRRLRSWLRFVHTGEAGGITGQTVAATASAGAAVLVWTGLCLAGRRFLRWKRRAPLPPGASSLEPANLRGGR